MRQKRTTFLAIAFFIILCVGMILTFEIGLNNIKSKHVNHVYDEVAQTSAPGGGLGEAHPG